MWKNIIVICGLFLVGSGMYYAYDGLKFSVPERMTVEEFATGDRSPGTILLTDARLNLLKAVVMTEGEQGKIKKLYLPVESADYTQEDRTSLLLETDDEKLLKIASEFHTMKKQEQMKYVVHHRDKLLQETELSGIMLDTASMRADRQKEIRSVVPNLADDFFLLRHHAQINLIPSLVICVLGLFVLIFGLFREKRAEPSSNIEDTETAPAS